MMQYVIDNLLESLSEKAIKYGNVQIETASGKKINAGNREGEEIKVKFSSTKAQWSLILNPGVSFGEIYMDGDLIFQKGSLYDLLLVLLTNRKRYEESDRAIGPGIFSTFLQWCLGKKNNLKNSLTNVAHHYNIDRKLFEMFLDKDLQYTCAYFEKKGMSIEEAQLAKKRHIASKLYVGDSIRSNKPLSIVDLGCGWGGMAMYLAKVCRASVLGVTLSEEQVKLAEERIQTIDDTINKKLNFKLEDYRNVEGKYDRVVSVGMLEHVGPLFYDSFFRKVYELLKPGGVAVIHSICLPSGPKIPDEWTRKYIFPGGYVPAVSEVIPSAEKSGLYITDIEILRLHYADTLRAWHNRFNKNIKTVEKMYDTRFCRMWEFYLASSEASFRVGSLAIVQLQLTKELDTLPTTRSYISADNLLLRQEESKHDLSRKSI